VSRILGLPDHVKPIGIITLGYSNERPGNLIRIDISRLVFHDKYGNTQPVILVSFCKCIVKSFGKRNAIVIGY
jgi:hypothetical protein